MMGIHIYNFAAELIDYRRFSTNSLAVTQSLVFLQFRLRSLRFRMLLGFQLSSTVALIAAMAKGFGWM
jgi:hypothetical protein